MKIYSYFVIFCLTFIVSAFFNESRDYDKSMPMISFIISTFFTFFIFLIFGVER